MDNTHILAILDQFTSRLEQLEIILLGEQAALSQDDFDQLDEYSNSKLQLTGEIMQLEHQHQDLVSRFMESTLAEQLVNSSSMQQRFEHLRTLSNKCRNLNQVNGALLESLRRSIQSRLDILTGRSTAESLYSEKGTTTASGGGQSLARV